MNASIPALATLALSWAAGATAPDRPVGDDVSDVVLEEIRIVAPEPRFVAPTTRDRIGRVWVPVHIDGHGPFRLVLDTGAQRSAVVPQVAQRLGIPLDRAPPVRLHGVTGTSIAPTIDVQYLSVGDVWLRSSRLPVVPDAFGGAEGLLGVDGLQDRRILIDFRADYVDISRSKDRRAGADFLALPFVPEARQLAVRARVGHVNVLAIVDTGAQATVGNEALRRALRRQVAGRTAGPDEIHGATGDVQTGTGVRIPDIALGGLRIEDAHVTFSDLHIFNTWELTDTPVLLLGMDILGLVDTLVIDYRRRELHIRPRRG